jgi:hypothetical protein
VCGKGRKECEWISEQGKGLWCWFGLLCGLTWKTSSTK